MSELISIVHKPHNAPPAVGAFTRVPLREAQLVAGYGIEGDAKGGSQKRQLNIMSAETMQKLAAEGFLTGPGQLGEEITIAGMAIDVLPVGTLLRIGEQARVEVTEPRVGCGRFEEYQGKLRENAAGRMGVMARVIEGGMIRVGDVVSIVPSEGGI